MSVQFKGARLVFRGSIRASPAHGHDAQRPVTTTSIISTGFYSPSTAGERPWMLGHIPCELSNFSDTGDC